MAIVQPKSEYWNSEIKNNISFPIIFVDGESDMYLHINEINEELEKFILTEKTDALELHVLPEEQEQAKESYWRELGFVVTYHRQKFSYMHHSMSVIYPQIINPATGAKITLLPWFILPGRPYPIFTYIYAIWHYHSTEKKSQKESAAATGKLFGLKSFNKSTVSRSIKAMENIIELAGIDTSVPVEEPKQPSDCELFEYVPKILNGAIKIEEIKAQYGDAVKRLPAPINEGSPVQRALSGIPSEYSKVIEWRVPEKRRASDRRKRPPRPRNKEKKLKPRRVLFVDDTQIKKTRIAFIEICKGLVMNAAAAYHTYLI